MEITAKCVYDLKAVTAVQHVGMYKKRNPKKCIFWWMAACILLIVLMILEDLFLDADMTELIVLLLAAMGVMCFVHFLTPRITYRGQGSMRDAENTYVFGETGVSITSKADHYTGEAQVEYPLFLQVYETSRYFFLFQTKRQVFAVDKSTIQGGTVEDIRNRLSGAVKKYVICKY